MIKVFTCILCPNGCDIEVNYTENGICSCSGNLCKNGEKYIHQELENPCRTISTSVIVEGGDLPLVSVRLTSPIPRDRIPDAVKYIHTLHVSAPVKSGDILAENILGLNSNVIATRTTRKI